MTVYLTYHWENVVINVERDTGGLSPHTRPVIADIDYDYEATATDEDIVDYLTPVVLREGDKEIYVRAIRHTLTNLHDYINYDELAEDEGFIEFLTERYEEKAREQFDEENDSY